MRSHGRSNAAEESELPWIPATEAMKMLGRDVVKAAARNTVKNANKVTCHYGGLREEVTVLASRTLGVNHDV